MSQTSSIKDLGLTRQHKVMLQVIRAADEYLTAELI